MVNRTDTGYPTGFSLQPVATGAVVRMVREYLTDGTMAYSFAYENAEDGTCG